MNKVICGWGMLDSKKKNNCPLLNLNDDWSVMVAGEKGFYCKLGYPVKAVAGLREVHSDECKLKSIETDSKVFTPTIRTTR